VALLGAARSVAAQGPDAGAWNANRAELTQALATLERYAASPAYSARARAEASARVEAVRRRLNEGDFREGDRIVFEMSGALPRRDTVTIQEGPQLVLAPFGALPLRGVLRAEIEERMTAFVRTSVLDAQVRVLPLVRLAVFGSVATPAYLSVSLETRLDELIMRAGGPVTEADPSTVTVMRGEEIVLDGSEVLAAISEGRTIGSLALREGDYVSLRPRPPEWDRAAVLSIVGLIATPLITFLLVRR
jgi:hypothetical protein